MKKLIYSFLLITAATMAGLGASEVSAPYIIQITDVTEDMLGMFLAGEVHNVIVEFPEDTYIPVKYLLTGNLINLVPEERPPVYLKIMRTFYLKMDAEGYLFSTDMQNWKQYSDFMSGEVSCSIKLCNGQLTFCSECTLQVNE